MEAPRLTHQLRDSLASGDAPAFRRASHTLKSSLRLFGAHAAADQAWQLEQLGKEGDLQTAAQHVDALIAAVEQAVRAAQQGAPDVGWASKDSIHIVRVLQHIRETRRHVGLCAVRSHQLLVDVIGNVIAQRKGPAIGKHRHHHARMIGRRTRNLRDDRRPFAVLILARR